MNRQTCSVGIVPSLRPDRCGTPQHRRDAEEPQVQSGDCRCRVGRLSGDASIQGRESRCRGGGRRCARHLAGLQHLRPGCRETFASTLALLRVWRHSASRCQRGEKYPRRCTDLYYEVYAASSVPTDCANRPRFLAYTPSVWREQFATRRDSRNASTASVRRARAFRGASGRGTAAKPASLLGWWAVQVSNLRPCLLGRTSPKRTILSEKLEG